MPDRLRTILRGIGITGATSVLLGIGSTAWLAVPLVSFASCSNQGEGERCANFGGADAAANGSNECASGLVCTPAGSHFTSTAAGATSTELGVCCPPAGTASSSPACNSTPGGSTTGGQPEAGSGLDGAADASADAPPSDAALDADSASKDGTVTDAPGDSSPPVDGTLTDAPTDSSPADGSSPSDAPVDALPDTATAG